MATRPAAQLELELPPEALAQPPLERPAPSAPRRATTSGRTRGRRLRLWVAVPALVILALAAALIFYQWDQFLARDARFALAAQPSGLRFEGAVYVSAVKLRQVFARDFGRSVYLIPLESRRRELLAVDWVREARVERHWPNRIVARIAERTPVAFLLLPSAPGAAARTALIDAEGVILEPPPRARFAFPVLQGLSSTQPPALRRQKVETFLSFMREAGAHAGLISEVDLSDPENLKVTALVEGVPARLWLGNANLRARLENFLSNQAEIRRLLPQSGVFDLRLERHITALKAPTAPARPGAAAPPRKEAGRAR